MYLSSTGQTMPTSDAVARGGGAPTWHKGAMSKRFDMKDETPSTSTTTAKPVAPVIPIASLHFFSTFSDGMLQIQVSSNVTKDDEAAAMAAMFQAQTQNWEEAQEKMSQLVSTLCGFLLYRRPLSNERCLFLSICVSYSAQAIHRNPRGTGFGGRGGKPHAPDKPLPPSYVCYRCGQKGSQ